MFQRSSSLNSHNKGSKIKTVIQISLLLTVIAWLVNHISKNAHAGGDELNLDQGQEIDFGQKGIAGSENVMVTDSEVGRKEAVEFPDNNTSLAEATGDNTFELRFR